MALLLDLPGVVDRLVADPSLDEGPLTLQHGFVAGDLLGEADESPLQLQAVRIKREASPRLLVAASSGGLQVLTLRPAVLPTPLQEEHRTLQVEQAHSQLPGVPAETLQASVAQLSLILQSLNLEFVVASSGPLQPFGSSLRLGHPHRSERLDDAGHYGADGDDAKDCK